jgi:hypothetical protein
MLDFDTLRRQHFILLLLVFTQLIGCSFFHPLPLVWDVQLSAFIHLFEALKAQVQPYYLLLKPVHGRSKAILQQRVIMLAAGITLTDIKDAPVFVGQTQRL